MNDKNIELDIEINYENQKLTFSSIKSITQIKLEKLVKESIRKFKISQENGKNIYFAYIDDDGDINRINTIEDIYICSKEKPNSDNYISQIYLIIGQNEINILNNKSNNNNISKNYINYLEENENLKKYLEKIKREKDEKIKELEEKIEKMKKDHLEEINNIKKNSIKEKEKNQILEKI